MSLPHVIGACAVAFSLGALWSYWTWTRQMRRLRSQRTGGTVRDLLCPACARDVAAADALVDADDTPRRCWRCRKHWRWTYTD